MENKTRFNDGEYHRVVGELANDYEMIYAPTASGSMKISDINQPKSDYSSLKKANEKVEKVLDLVKNSYYRTDNAFYNFLSYSREDNELQFCIIIHSGKEGHFSYYRDYTFCIGEESFDRLLKKLEPMSEEQWKDAEEAVNSYEGILKELSENNSKAETIGDFFFIPECELGFRYRLCDSTKDMTCKEYKKFVSELNEESTRRLEQYADELRSRYTGKTVLISNSDLGFKNICRVSDIFAEKESINVRSNVGYDIELDLECVENVYIHYGKHIIRDVSGVICEIDPEYSKKIETAYFNLRNLMNPLIGTSN